jgi:hypothetical protein
MQSSNGTQTHSGTTTAVRMQSSSCPQTHRGTTTAVMSSRYPPFIAFFHPSAAVLQGHNLQLKPKFESGPSHFSLDRYNQARSTWSQLVVNRGSI